MARKGLAAKYIHAAKRMGGTAKTLFKRAWRLQKQAKGGRKTTATKKGAHTMAKRRSKQTVRYITRYKKNPGNPGNPGRKKQRVTLMRNKWFNAGMNVGVTTGSALLSTFAVNKTPWIKDLRSWQKGGGQFLVFLFLSFLNKNLWYKKATLGAAGGGVLTAALPFLSERGIKIFGNRRNLTPYQKSKLQYGNYSVRQSANGVSGPVDYMAGPVDWMAGPWPSNNMGGAPMISRYKFQSVQTPTGY